MEQQTKYFLTDRKDDRHEMRHFGRKDDRLAGNGYSMYVCGVRGAMTDKLVYKDRRPLCPVCDQKCLSNNIITVSDVTW